MKVCRQGVPNVQLSAVRKSHPVRSLKEGNSKMSESIGFIKTVGTLKRLAVTEMLSTTWAICDLMFEGVLEGESMTIPMTLPF